MTILEHLEELRRRLIVSVLWVAAGVAVSAVFGDRIIRFLREPAEAYPGQVNFQFIEPFEFLGVYFRVAVLGGLVFGMPMLVYQLLAFVSPGLTRQERRWLNGTVAGASLLFLGGCAFAYYVALPPALRFLLGLGGEIAQPNLRIGSYVDFVTRLIFWTGLTFETPLVVMYLSRFRLLTWRQMLGFWRYAVVLAFVIAAVVTPTWDPVTQSLVAGPIVVLYFLGVFLAWLVEPRRQEEAARERGRPGLA